MSEQYRYEVGEQSDLDDIGATMVWIESVTKPLPPKVFHAETLIAKTEYGNVMMATMLFYDNGHRTVTFTPNPMETGKSSPVCLYSDDVDHLKRTVEMMARSGIIAAMVLGR